MCTSGTAHWMHLEVVLWHDPRVGVPGGGGGAHLGIYVLQAEKLGSSRGSCPWISGEDVMCGL